MGDSWTSSPMVDAYIVMIVTSMPSPNTHRRARVDSASSIQKTRANLKLEGDAVTIRRAERRRGGSRW